MRATLRNRLQSWIQNWALRRQGRDSDKVVLHRKRIYILPTRAGLVFALMLFAMLLGSMNYSNSMGFVLTFLLGALGLLAMHYCHATLNRLSLRAGRTESVFAGQSAQFILVAENNERQGRYGLTISDQGVSTAAVDIPSGATAVLLLPRAADKRGILHAGRFSISTTFPFGLFRAWTWLHMELDCLVYPRPVPENTVPPPVSTDSGHGKPDELGQEDFSGLRNYRQGDSPRHIAWKAYAREQGLLVKQFSGVRGTTCWLDWEVTPAELDVEQRLSILCRWVLDVHARGESYGLRLPRRLIPIGHGEHHRRACLEALALFESAREQVAA